MCGIAGIIRFNGSTILTNEIDELTDSLAHRGPDGRGTWFNQNKNIALGHRRLSILDLSDAGHQPMISKDGSLSLVLNGEIFNFIEIKNELKAKGHTFISHTDTEVVLTAYKQWGLKMLDKFNGMWAMAIYNSKTHCLTLSRDRFGVKPLYYFYDENELVFASEVKSLHKHLGQRVSINDKTIEAILRFDHSYHSTDQTYLNQVKSLKAGSNLILDNGKIELSQWYSLAKIKVPKTFDEQASVLKEILKDAIKIRLRSDVPVGTCLSGGIDSGAISSLINTFNANDDKRFSNFTHRSFCAGFPGLDLDETKDAVRLANQLDIKLDVEIINPPSIILLEKAMRETDGPMPAFAFFPIWQLYDYIKKQNITVTLDGQGADEMLGGYFLGYESMKGALELGDLFWLYDLKRTYGDIHPKAQQWASDHFNNVKEEKIRQIKQTLKLPVKKLLALIGLYTFKPLKVASSNITNSSIKDNTFEEALYNQFFKTPLPFLLHQYDRASMANGIECRMPFMDYRVVEYIFALPAQSKVGSGYTKRVLREALNGILPDETRLNKLKTGFNAPTTEWFKTDLNEWFVSQISSKSFIENPYFDGDKMSKEFLKMIESDKADNYKWKYWAYIHVNYWLNNLPK
jgi:asparagine synthase (glutamine-hydrolysing)